jgi:hypothetical protein
VNADDAVVAVLNALDTARIPFMVVGSLASNVHGIPRSTRDADVVIEVRPGALDALAGALPGSLRLRSQSSFETVTGTLRHLVEVSGEPFVCELFVLGNDPHDQQRFDRRQQVQMFGRPVYIATAEDMIVTKLRWARDAGRSKDRDDVRNIVAVRGRALDWAYVERWASEHGTLALLEAIRQSVPEAM